MLRLASPAAIALALLALTACAREGPPAPVTMGGEPSTKAAAGARVATPLPTVPPRRSEAPSHLPATTKPAAQATESTRPPPAPAPPSEKPQAPPAAPSPPPDQIVVGKGETLYMIARRYDLPVRAIIDANHLDPPFQLAVGTTLSLPQTRYHTVEAGETLYGVSRRYGVEVSTLASINHLAAPYAIRSGQVLALPSPVLPQEKPDASALAAPVPKPKSSPAAPATNPEPSKPDASAFVEPPPEPKPRAGRIFAWPLEGRIIEAYGTGPTGTHNDGINIAARLGEPVRAADGGRVAYAGNELRGYGNLVLIKHPSGYMTAYAHNGKLLVRRGQLVKRGQEIAKAGATGSVNSPQLHFEIRRGTRALDPTDYLPSLHASAN